MGEKTDTNREAARKYAERQREAGLVRVCAWVPKDKRDKLLDIAADMVDDHLTRLLPR